MEDIRDIKGLVPVPHSWWWLLIPLALVVIAVAIWLWRRGRKPILAAPVVRVLTPLEAALAALQQLRQDAPPAEEFYTRLSDIIRHYIENRFGLRAPERTTEEFLAEATLPAQHMTLLGAFLREADLVKFARLRPGTEDMDRAATAGERFIRESA
jgi:hypothetical protein